MTGTEFMTLRENADIKIIDVKTDLFKQLRRLRFAEDSGESSGRKG